MVLGIPVDFILFACTLAGVALFHKHVLKIAVTGLATITLYKLLFSPFATGAGVSGLVSHLGHEWVVVANLFALLVPALRCWPTALREEPRAGRSCPRCCRTTGRAASSCWSWCSCCRASSTTSPPP
jgi:hypothetical protein